MISLDNQPNTSGKLSNSMTLRTSALIAIFRGNALDRAIYSDSLDCHLETTA